MNVAGILSLGASLDLFNKYGIENIEKRILELTNFAADVFAVKKYRNNKYYGRKASIWYFDI